MSSYYVSPNGDDTNNNGLSAAAPWKSIAKINALDLNAGDQVLFEGGSTFTNPNDGPISITNPGFETGTNAGWTSFFTNTQIENTDVHSGSFAAQTTTPVGSVVGGAVQDVTAQVQPNIAYNFSGWAKITAGTGVGYVGINFKKAGVILGSAAIIVTETNWKQYQITDVAPSSFDTAELFSYKYEGTSVLTADDFRVTRSANMIALKAEDTGTSVSPITIGTYGAGRATLMTGDAAGILSNDAAGIVVNHLKFVGSWNAANASGPNFNSGIDFNSNQLLNGKLNFFRVDDVDVSGYRYSGVNFAGKNVKAGFNDVRVTNSVLHDNGLAGIRAFIATKVTGTYANLYAHSNFYVGYNQTYNNSGITDWADNSGNGIVLSDVNGATIEHNVAYNNGQFNSNTRGGGPIGIWIFDSNAATIQYNEAYNNKSGNTYDGGGFDLDGGMTNSVMQYNYSHGNKGAGFMMYQQSGSRNWNNNTVRYNISENDCRGGGYGGLFIGGLLTNAAAYHNTVYMTPFAGVTPAAVRLRQLSSNVTVRNNIIITTGGVRVLDFAQPNAAVLVQGNDYYAGTTASNFKILWGTTTYTSLAAFRTATGQERLNGADTGFQLDPQVNSAGAGGTIGFGNSPNLLTAYQLKSTSPMINAGLNLPTLFGTSVGTQDFYGGTIPAAGAFDIGADEFAQVQSGPPVANAGGPYSVNEGTDVALNGGLSTGTISTYEWDFDYDGVNFNTDATGVTTNIPGASLDGPLSRTIALRVSGPNGTDLKTTTLTVANVAPTVNAGPDAQIQPGGTFNGSGSFTDPGPDTWTATVDYNDGNGPQALALNGKSFSLSKVYANAGTYNVVVKVTDDNGDFNTDTVVVNVSQVVVPSYTSLNIGNVSPTSGTNVINDGKDYDVTAGGNGAWNATDNVRFVYSQRNGNFDIKVRVASISGGDPTIAEGGLMVRESLAGNARNAFLYARPDAKDTLQYRAAAGGTTNNAGGAAGTAYPNNWIRLQRVGDVITGYRSADGITWTKTASTTLASLTSTVYVGLAVSSRTTSSATTVQFRDLADLV